MAINTTTPTTVQEALFDLERANITLQGANSILQNTSTSDAVAFATALANYNLAHVDYEQAVSNLETLSSASTQPSADDIAAANAIGVDIVSILNPAAVVCETIDQFQGMRFYDGTAFGFLRVFADKVQLLVDEPLEFPLDGTMPHTYRLVGQGSNLKLYVDGQLAIDASGKFNQPTASKIIEFGDIAGRQQNVSSFWNAFKYTTAGAFSPSNTEDLILEQQVSFPSSSIGRLKTYNNALYASIDPANPDLSSSVFRFTEGIPSQHRSVKAITQSSASCVLVDPSRNASIFGSTGKYFGSDSGLQYIIGSKPTPFDFTTSFEQPLDGNGWTQISGCKGACDSLLGGVLEIDTTGEVDLVVDKYTQDLPTDAWVAGADNTAGWTVEVRVKVVDDGSGGTVDSSISFSSSSDVQCQTITTPSTDDNIFGPGIFINDGKYQETVQFFQKGIRLKFARIFGAQTLTDQFYTIRIIGKGKNIAVFAKGDSDQDFHTVILGADALGVAAHDVQAQANPAVFTDEAGIVHAVWEQDSKEGSVIAYSRLNHRTIANGGGIIGANVFNPAQTALTSRSGIGLPAAPYLNYKQLPANVLIAPDGTFVDKGVRAGDFLQIFDQVAAPTFVINNGVVSEVPTTAVGRPKQYVIKKVIDDVLIELDTSDDLSNIGPSEWQVVSGDLIWSPTVKVSTEPFDSSNPRILYHSSGVVVVAYDNDQGGNSEIFIKAGRITANGVSWEQPLQLTNSSHDAKTADIAEMQNGQVMVVWQDSTNDATGSQIFFSTILLSARKAAAPQPGRITEQTEIRGAPTPSLSIASQPVTLTPASLHARKPKIASDRAGEIEVVYEDDVDGKFGIYAVGISDPAAGPAAQDPVKISGDALAMNPTVVHSTTGFFAAWENYALGNAEIVGGNLINFSAQIWTFTRYTSSRGSSRNPSIATDKFGAPVIVYQSDRTRLGFFELYLSKLGIFRFPDGLTFVAAASASTFPSIIGTPTRPGLYRLTVIASNPAGSTNTEITINVIPSGSPSFGPIPSPAPTDLPVIVSPLSMTAVVGQAFSYQFSLLNGPASVTVSRAKFVSSAFDGLDVKLKSYMTQNTRPAISTMFDGSIAIVWEGEREALLPSIFATIYDTSSSSMDETVVAYFPFNEKIGKIVHNRVLSFDFNGFLEEEEGPIPANGTAFHSVDVYQADPVEPGASLFNPADENAFDFGRTGGDGFKGGFSIATDPYIGQSGAVEMYVKPHWDSSSVASHVFFGNGPMLTTIPNTMVFGVGPAFVGNTMRFRIVDGSGVVHETLVDNPALWSAEDSVHLRVTWDSSSIGASSINGISFASATAGLACGANGSIFSTPDGGNTWSKQTTGITYDLYSVDFLTASIAFACGELGTVLFTTNGGGTWTVVDSGVTADLKSIFFLTSSIGYACGSGGTILKSTDGGVLWSAVTFIGTAPSADFNSIAVLGDGTTIIAVGDSGQVWISADGITFAAASVPKFSDWNAVSRTHQAGPFTTYVVGDAGAILRTSDNAVSWTDLSASGPDSIVPDLLSVSHGSTSSNVWIPWGTNKFAFSSDSATTLNFLSASAAGSYRSIDANFGGLSVGTSAVMTGSGGIVLLASGSGAVQSTARTASENLVIFVDGKQPPQHRNGDGPFSWNPDGQSLFFGDYRAQGTDSADAVFDDLVIYGTPTPGNSAFNRHEFRTFQTISVPVVGDNDGKRIEFGNISQLIKSDTQWSRFDMFFCGAKEPLRTFAWNVSTNLIDNVVNGMALDSNGSVWLATNNGVSIFDSNKAAQSINAFLSGAAQPKFDSPIITNLSNLAHNLVADQVTCIDVDENGDVWAGTTSGLMLLQRQSTTASFTDPVALADSGQSTAPSSDSLQFSSFSTNDGLPSNNILSVRGVKGGVLVGTDKGLVAIQRDQQQQADTTAASLSASTSASAQQATAAVIATAPTIQPFSIFTTGDGLPSNRIQGIAQESGGAIWLATDLGLVLFRVSKSILYNTSNGLLSKDIQSVFIDSSNRKILGTGFGLSILDGSTVTNFPPSSGIGPGAINGADEDSSGVIWLAGANGLVEFNRNCLPPRFATYTIQDGIIGEDRIIDYLRYRILGAALPSGSCPKALVIVAVNGKQIDTGFTVDASTNMIIFDSPLGPSDDVDVCVLPGWRKVHDFNFDNSVSAVSQAAVETSKSKYLLYGKRMSAGSVSLGANFASGASNLSALQYSVFATPLPGGVGPVIGPIENPGTAVRLSTTSIGDSMYSDISDEITTLPSELLEAEHIAMASTDSLRVEDDYLDFTLLADAIVYVAFDSRASSLPTWLQSFSPTPILVRVSDMETFTDGTGEEALFVATKGTNGCVYKVLRAPNSCDISNQIALDSTPPTGCATISKVNSSTSFTLSLTATDAVTGVADMQIAPRQDGTIDGETPAPFIPFQTNFVFVLPPAASATTGVIGGLPPDTVPGGTAKPLPPGIINTVFHNFNGALLIGTKTPGRVYSFDQKTNVATLLFDTGENEVLSMATFGNNLLVGTGTNGKTFEWDGVSLTQLPIASGQRVLSVSVFANQAFLGYSPNGQIYTLDQFGTMQLFLETFETAVTDFAVFGNFLYWSTANETIDPGDTLTTTTTLSHKHFFVVPPATMMLSQANGFTSAAPDGHVHQVINGIVQPGGTPSHIHGLNGSVSGKIFRYDPGTGQPIIVHADTDYAVTALSSSSTDASGLLFAGTSPHGKILRFVPDEQIFIKSFQTPGLTVNRLRVIGNTFALVDNVIYDFTGTRWEFVAAVDDSAHDVAPDVNSSTGQIVVLRDKVIASTSTAPSEVNPNICAYVRFRDVAGNVSSVTDSTGALIDCYAPCLNLTTGSTNGTGGTTGLTIGKNRLLEVDQTAKIVFGLDGTEPFLSGNKVEKEVAVYFSEIFNGTNTFVQWTSISWVAATPPGTSVTIAVRSADTSSGISAAIWSAEFTNPASNDLTNLTGQFLQFRATLTSFAKGAPSPILSVVQIGLRTSQAVHYFTTNFSLPDILLKGILTYNGCVNPPVTDVVFGITGMDSTDFSDYFVISPDKVFDLPSEQQTKNLRVGIKLISSPTEVAIVDEFALLVSLANDAKVKFNLAGQPSSTNGQLAPVVGSRTVITERVQNHTHTITFDATILDQSNINGTTSINAGHAHQIINGVVQQAAGHTHAFSI